MLFKFFIWIWYIHLIIWGMKIFFKFPETFLNETAVKNKNMGTWSSFQCRWYRKIIWTLSVRHNGIFAGGIFCGHLGVLCVDTSRKFRKKSQILGKKYFSTGQNFKSISPQVPSPPPKIDLVSIPFSTEIAFYCWRIYWDRSNDSYKVIFKLDEPRLWISFT